MARYDYHTLVIGGGPAGLVAAKVVRALGKRVAIIEKENHLGGDCTWTGCVPSKTLIHIANMAHAARCARRYTDPIGEKYFINTALVMNKVRHTIREVYKTHTPQKLQEAGIDIVIDSPRFVDAHTLQLKDRLISAKKIIIATGSRPFVPPIPGIERVPYLTNETLFELDRLPKSMIILGAGPIGIEMASALNRLGIDVTVVERSGTILPKEDTELSELLRHHLQSEGVRFMLASDASGVQQKDGRIVLETIQGADVHIVEAQSLLIAVGRKPAIVDLDLAKAGVTLDDHGIVVNDKMQTTVSHIYAVGDVVGPYLFSHMAEYQATIAARNACVPLIKKRVDYTLVPWVTFSAPELATLGLSERQARIKYGNSIVIYTMPYNALDRAKTDNAELGLVKIICNRRGRILGATILGERAGEVIHEIAVGATYGKKIYDFYNVIHAYPTYSELVWHVSKRATVSWLRGSMVFKLARFFGLVKE